MSDNDNGLIVLHTCLALTRELEDSLLSSQIALLARDSAAIERCTREQERLRQMVRGLLGSPDLPAPIPAPRESRLVSPQGASELVERLRASAMRVQHLARVQLALLRRSQQFLNVLANWMASPETPYRPQPTAGGGLSVGAVPHAYQVF
jgi:hypothetical protein